MTITLPDEMKDELERKSRAAGFDTVSEYVCWLVQDPKPGGAEVTPEDLGFSNEAEMEAKLLAALNSGPPIPVTPQFWDELRKEVAERADQITGQQ